MADEALMREAVVFNGIALRFRDRAKRCAKDAPDAVEMHQALADIAEEFAVHLKGMAEGRD